MEADDDKLLKGGRGGGGKVAPAGTGELTADRPPAGGGPIYVVALLVAWLALGFIFAGHWIMVKVWSKKGGETPAPNVRALWHACSYWVASAVLAVGGTWCLRSGTYTVCYVEGTNRTKNVTMSWDCLMYDQTPEYRWIYITQFVALSFMLAHWIADLCQLRTWSVAIHCSGAAASTTAAESRALKLFGVDGTSVDDNIHWAIVLSSTFMVTLTWTGIHTAWTTGEEGVNDDGPNSLSHVSRYVFAEMFVIPVMWWVGLALWQRSRMAPVYG